jgi:peptide-methionine (S)-S-oxide reductase
MHWPASRPTVTTAVCTGLLSAMCLLTGCFGPSEAGSARSSGTGATPAAPQAAPAAPASDKSADTTTKPAQEPRVHSTPATDPAKQGEAAPAPAFQYATFGAGCFWGPELKFSKLPGVLDAEVGYTGGRTTNPTYKEVCYEDTGHAEVVRVKYDPTKIAYTQLLEAFFAMHDPTQVNRQGPDYGTQYRTCIFAADDKQLQEANAFKAKLQASGKFSRPIATSIELAGPFYLAEDYHQDYLKKRGMDSCGTP